MKGAELVARQYDISREQMEEFAVLSHQRAHEATIEGRFRKEIVPITYVDKNGKTVVHDTDEGIRYPIDKTKIAKLPTLSEGGILTAAISR